jgi:protein involved in polysaccharide export with SLBB domain
MFKVLLKKISLPVVAIGLLSAGQMAAQTSATDQKPVNFRYSQNPKIKTRPEPAAVKSPGTPTLSNADSQTTATGVVGARNTPPPSIAAKTLEIAKRANAAAIAPTEIYKVGAGDVLFINLQNAAKASTYFTVLNDGTIDYPLAGEMVTVGGLTVEEIEDILREKIKLYESPQVSVKVREYASHSVKVLGLVEESGVKNIQREAVPLFVIKAEAVVQPKATYAIVRRANSQTETLNLRDPKVDDVLIFPGDIVEFASNTTGGNSSGEFYFVAGEVISAGQKDYHPGLTLSQAIMASGGTKKANVKKVIIRRKNAAGYLMPIEYSLKNIKDGKEADPVLQAGDTIEVGN